ncbi:hypothetical protein ACF0H5_014966 [Mactra antiquata]
MRDPNMLSFLILVCATCLKDNPMQEKTFPFYSVPVLCIFILFAVVAIAISASINIHTSSISKRKSDVPISEIYKYLVKISFVKKSKSKRGKVEHNDKETDATKVDMNNASDRASDKPEKEQEKEMRQYNTDNDDITWSDVCTAVDRVSLLGIIVAVVVPCLIILIYIAAASDYNDPKTPF